LKLTRSEALSREQRSTSVHERRVPDLMDLAGVDAKYGTPEETRKMIERMREEYWRIL
jgi:hypothetical protein